MKVYIKFILITLLAVLSCISYIPDVFANPELYGRIHQILTLCIFSLFAISLNIKKLIHNRFMNYILIPLGVLIILMGIFYGMGFRTSLVDIILIGIIYASLWIGHELNLKNNHLIVLLFIYSITSVYLGYSSITTYLTSFSMEESMYLIDAKNQIGAIVAVATFLMLYVGQISTHKYTCLLAYIIFAILLILLIFIRCRTALAAFIITACLLVFKLNNAQKLYKYAIIGLIVAAIFSEQIIDVMRNTFIGDRSVTNMDELSSNRVERNEMAIDYLNYNLFIGELEYHSDIPQIHNYILNRLVRYGIWGLPLIFIYFVFVVKIFKQTVKSTKFTLADIGYFVTIIPFLCSLLEPDAPFGPGTVQAFTYILFGISLKSSLNKY